MARRDVKAGIFPTFFLSGFECSTFLWNDGKRRDLIAQTQHRDHALEDYRLLQQLGIAVSREGVPWPQVAQRYGGYDFSAIEPMIDAMRQSPCLNLVLPDPERVALLMEDYAFFVRDTAYFCDRLQVLTEFRGKAVVQDWQDSVRAGQIEPVVQELLTLHYDPVYLQSMRRNFKQYESSKMIAPEDHSAGAMAKLAQQILDDRG